MSSSIDYSSTETQFAMDMNKSPFFKKDDQNYMTIASVEQLNTLKHVSFLDMHLSKDNVIEPHYHQTSAEIIYCIAGGASVALLNPFTKQYLHYSLSPGKIVNIPRGWWHYIIATADDTHLFGTFDAPKPEVILGSDILTLTSPEIMAHTYCLDETQWKKAISPIKPSMFIGPPNDCHQPNSHPHTSSNPYSHYRY